MGANQSENIQDLDFEWQWQANSDPWSAKQKQIWKPHDQKCNVKIELAFKRKENTIDIGKYIIMFDAMLQTSKADQRNARLIRRINKKP